MKNIVFARIDERLLHGQVVMTWVSTVQATKIYVVDDGTAKNSMMCMLYKKLAPAGTTCEVLTVEKAIEVLKGEPENPKEKVMLLAKIPQVYETLIDGGVKIDRVCLGGMGGNSTRSPFIENVSANQEEIDSMKHMIEKGVDVYYQVTSSSKSVDVKTIIK